MCKNPHEEEITRLSQKSHYETYLIQKQTSIIGELKILIVDLNMVIAKDKSTEPQRQMLDANTKWEFCIGSVI